MTEDAWKIRCFWKSSAGGSPMPWTTQSSHACEQQARSAAQNVFEAYQDLGPLTIDLVEIRGPQSDWRTLLCAVGSGQGVVAGRSSRR